MERWDGAVNGEICISFAYDARQRAGQSRAEGNPQFGNRLEKLESWAHFMQMSPHHVTQIRRTQLVDSHFDIICINCC